MGGEKEKKSIAFISFPDLSDNSLQLFLHINQHYRDNKLVWLCAEIDVAKKKLTALNCDNGNNKLTVVKKNSVLGLLLFSKATLVFHTHGTYFFVTKAYKSCIVNLWHGMQIKAVGYLDNKTKYDVAYCDYSISTSSFHRTKMAQAFGIDESRVLVSGQPRNDALLGFSAIARENFYKTFAIEPDHSVIFWLPTYRVSNIGDIRVDSRTASFMSDFEDGFLHVLNTVLSKNKHTLIIKLHPMDAENNNDLFNETQFSHIRVLNQPRWASSPVELYSALAFSSALISDVSSVIADYVVTKKPIAIIEQAVLDYSRGLVPGLSKSQFLDSFYNINDINSFKHFLHSLREPSYHNYSEVFNEFDYQQISSSTYISNYFIGDQVII